MKKLLAAAFLLALTIAGGLGIAQTISIPVLSIVNPTDLIQDIPYGMPSAGNKYVNPAQITSQSGYYKSAYIVTSGLPTSAYTHIFGNTESFAAFANASAATYLYLQTAVMPSDGDRECAFSVGGVTTLYLTANLNQTINNAITAMTADTQYCYLYSASNATWDRN